MPEITEDVRPAEALANAMCSDGGVSLTAGQKVGRFRLVQYLGSGGQGQVWKAHDPTLDRDVAIKVVSDGPGGDETAGMASGLIKEGKALAAMRHNHLLRVYDAGRDEETRYSFIATELADSSAPPPRALERTDGSASELDVATALRFGADLASALAYMHDKQIVHRDVKPQNVLFMMEDRANQEQPEPHGSFKHIRAVLGDFGLVARCGDEPRAPARAGTQEPAPADVGEDQWGQHGDRGDDHGQPAAPMDSHLDAAAAKPAQRLPGEGTQGYAPPEQMGNPEDLLPAAPTMDVYALGVTLFEFLTGGIPNRAPLANSAFLGDEDLPDEAKRKIPFLRELLSHMLRSDPALRPSMARVERVLRELHEQASRGGFDNNPFRFNAALTVDDSALLLGRRVEVQELKTKIESSHVGLLAVIGTSGAGKSSVMQAGVYAEYCRANSAWKVLLMRPYDDAVQALLSALQSADGGHGWPTADELKSDPEALATALQRWPRLGDRRILLLVDQAEELYAPGARRGGAANDACGSRAEVFIKAVVAALKVMPDRLRPVLTLRSDYQTAYTEDVRWENYQREAYYLFPKPRQGDDAVFQEDIKVGLRKVAETRHVRFEGDGEPAKDGEQDLLGQLMKEAVKWTLPLAWLQVTVAHLWARRDLLNGVMTYDSYSDLQKKGGALALQESNALALQPSSSIQVLLPKLLLRLVERTDAGQADKPSWRRTRVSQAQLELEMGNQGKAKGRNNQVGENGTIATLVQALVDGRFLTQGAHTPLADGGVDGQDVLELVSDALIETWPRLRDVLAKAGQAPRSAQDAADALNQEGEEWVRGRSRRIWSLPAKFDGRADLVRSHLELLSDPGTAYYRHCGRIGRRRLVRSLLAAALVFAVAGIVAWAIWSNWRSKLDAQAKADLSEAKTEVASANAEAEKAKAAAADAMALAAKARAEAETQKAEAARDFAAKFMRSAAEFVDAAGQKMSSDVVFEFRKRFVEPADAALVVFSQRFPGQVDQVRLDWVGLRRNFAHWARMAGLKSPRMDDLALDSAWIAMDEIIARNVNLGAERGLDTAYTRALIQLATEVVYEYDQDETVAHIVCASEFSGLAQKAAGLCDAGQRMAMGFGRNCPVLSPECACRELVAATNVENDARYGETLCLREEWVRSPPTALDAAGMRWPIYAAWNHVMFTHSDYAEAVRALDGFSPSAMLTSDRRQHEISESATEQDIKELGQMRDLGERRHVLGWLELGAAVRRKMKFDSWYLSKGAAPIPDVAGAVADIPAAAHDLLYAHVWAKQVGIDSADVAYGLRSTIRPLSRAAQEEDLGSRWLDAGLSLRWIAAPDERDNATRRTKQTCEVLKRRFLLLADAESIRHDVLYIRVMGFASVCPEEIRAIVQSDDSSNGRAARRELQRMGFRMGSRDPGSRRDPSGSAGTRSRQDMDPSLDIVTGLRGLSPLLYEADLILWQILIRLEPNVAYVPLQNRGLEWSGATLAFRVRLAFLQVVALLLNQRGDELCGALQELLFTLNAVHVDAPINLENYTIPPLLGLRQRLEEEWTGVSREELDLLVRASWWIEMATRGEHLEPLMDALREVGRHRACAM